MDGKGTWSVKSSDLTRIAYVARYGKARWMQAVKLASRHRLRALKDYGLSEHWTAPEWLDLCFRLGFVCPLCGKDRPLTPHHRIELVQQGDNTILNILPLCSPCHTFVHSYRIDCGPNWLNDQCAMCKGFQPGCLVQRRRYWNGCWPLRQDMHTVLARVIEPECWDEMPNLEALGVGLFEGGLVLDAGGLRFWTQAKALYMEAHGGQLLPCPLVDLREIEVMTEEEAADALNEYESQQRSWCQRFTVGDTVLWVPGMSHAVVEEIIPPTRLRLSAHVEGVTVSLDTLRPWGAQAQIRMLVEPDRCSPSEVRLSVPLRSLMQLRRGGSRRGSSRTSPGSEL